MKEGGALQRIFAAALASLITAAAAKIGFDVPPEKAALYSLYAATAVAGALGEWTARRQAKDIKTMQADVQVIKPEVQADGQAGPVTKNAVSQIAETVAKIQTTVAGVKGDPTATAIQALLRGLK